jgi:hypothetical protein
MPMNPNLTSTLSEFSKGRPATERSNDPPLHRTARNLITTVWLWLGKLVSFGFARVLVIFVIGFAAGFAWQSYGGEVRKVIASSSPRLEWLAPAASAGTSSERLKATTLALATARQSLDKLATEISKLQAQDVVDPPRRRATR